MSDIPSLNEARSALERAHRAALAMDGSALRRALEEARERLGEIAEESQVQAARDKVAQALADLDGGSLDEMERLLERARADLAGA